MPLLSNAMVPTTERSAGPSDGDATSARGSDSGGPVERSPSLRHRCLRVLEGASFSAPRPGRPRWRERGRSPSVSMGMAAGLVLALMLLVAAKQTADSVVRWAGAAVGGETAASRAACTRRMAGPAPHSSLLGEERTNACSSAAWAHTGVGARHARHHAAPAPRAPRSAQTAMRRGLPWARPDTGPTKTRPRLAGRLLCRACSKREDPSRRSMQQQQQQQQRRGATARSSGAAFSRRRP